MSYPRYFVLQFFKKYRTTIPIPVAVSIPVQHRIIIIEIQQNQKGEDEKSWRKVQNKIKAKETQQVS